MKEDLIANALNNVVLQLKNLGPGNAAGDKDGAIEKLTLSVIASNELIVCALDGIVIAINRLTEVVEGRISSDMPDPS